MATLLQPFLAGPSKQVKGEPALHWLSPELHTLTPAAGGLGLAGAGFAGAGLLTGGFEGGFVAGAAAVLTVHWLAQPLAGQKAGSGLQPFFAGPSRQVKGTFWPQ